MACILGGLGLSGPHFGATFSYSVIVGEELEERIQSPETSEVGSSGILLCLSVGEGKEGLHCAGDMDLGAHIIQSSSHLPGRHFSS